MHIVPRTLLVDVREGKEKKKKFKDRFKGFGLSREDGGMLSCGWCWYLGEEIEVLICLFYSKCLVGEALSGPLAMGVQVRN